MSQTEQQQAARAKLEQAYAVAADVLVQALDGMAGAPAYAGDVANALRFLSAGSLHAAYVNLAWAARTIKEKEL